MTRYRIRNWPEYQHYKDRFPSWIKLHNSLITSEVWIMGTDQTRTLAIASMLLASRNKANDGTFNGDPEYVKRVAYLNTAPNFNQLIEFDFIEVVQDASMALAECYTREEERREEKRRGEIEPLPCPIDRIIDAYHQKMPNNPRCKVINSARRAAIKARWNEAAKLTCNPFGYTDTASGIAKWEEFFSICAESHFLTGRATPQPGKPPFFADIDFLFSPSGFAKVLENKYHREAAA